MLPEGPEALDLDQIGRACKYLMGCKIPQALGDLVEKRKPFTVLLHIKECKIIFASL